MTPEDNIASINTALAAARARLATDLSQKTANEARTADWLRNYRGQGSSSEADIALASCAADATRIASAIASDNAEIAQLTDQLNAAMKTKDAFDKAQAQAIAEGLTGDAAVKRAEGIVAGDKAKSTAIIIAATVIGLIALFWAWRTFMKKKAAK